MTAETDSFRWQLSGMQQHISLLCHAQNVEAVIHILLVFTILQDC